MALAGIAKILGARFPEAAEGLEQVARFDAAAAVLPWSEFYEPVSVIEQNAKGSGKYVNLNADILGAWAKHMAYSMRIRMRCCEPAVLRELHTGTALVATIALRAHLEAAAMASLCVLRLNEARTPDGLERLATLIPQTLFGTSLSKKAKRDERVRDMLSLAEQETIQIATAIDALDRFSYGEAANGSTAILYSLLCESAHPNHRGTRAFVNSKELAQEGWEIGYTVHEQLVAPVVVGIVDGLRLAMRAGYAAAEMLRVAAFENGPAPYQGLPEDEGRRIWAIFLAPDA